MRLKKWSILLAAAMVAAWLVVDVVRDAFEAVKYFSSQPQHLLYVAAMAFVGGLAALGFYRLSPRAQRHVRVFAWGAAASTLTTFVGFFAFCLASLSSFAVDSGSTTWVLIAWLAFSGIAAYLWFEFYRALRA